MGPKAAQDELSDFNTSISHRAHDPRPFVPTTPLFREQGPGADPPMRRLE